MRHLSGPGAHGGRTRTPTPVELEFQMVVGAGSTTDMNRYSSHTVILICLSSGPTHLWGLRTRPTWLALETNWAEVKRQAIKGLLGGHTHMHTNIQVHTQAL